MNAKVNSKLAWGLIILAVGVFFFIFNYREGIKDFFYFQTYTPGVFVDELSGKAGFNDEGERLFQRTDPEVVSQNELNQYCAELHNIGCIVDGPKIYVLEFKGDSALKSQAIVTSAHEMLHYAYFRLSDGERSEVDALLEAELRRQNGAGLVNQVDVIYSYDSSVQLDEAHSIFGSESLELGAELEDYYSQYFIDRQASVSENIRSLAP